MTLHVHRRIDSVPAHAYTLPVVREVPIQAGRGAGGTTMILPGPATYPGSTAW